MNRRSIESHSCKYELYGSFSVKWNGIAKKIILQFVSECGLSIAFQSIFQSSILNATSWTYLYELTFSSERTRPNFSFNANVPRNRYFNNQITFPHKILIHFVERMNPFLCHIPISISLDGVRDLILAFNLQILLGIVIAWFRMLSFSICENSHRRNCGIVADACLDVAKCTFYDRRGVERNRALVTN